MLDKIEEKDLVLEEVPFEDFGELVKGVQPFQPDSYQIEAMVRATMQYNHLPLLGAKVFTPKAALLRYKMVVITPVASAEDLSSLSLYWSPSHLSDEGVYHLLRSLPDLTWARATLVRQIPLYLRPNMDSIVQRLSSGYLKPKLHLPLKVYVMGKTVPPVPKLPEGYYMQALDECYAQEVLSRWKYTCSETLTTIEKIFKKLPAVGIFKIRSSVDNREDRKFHEDDSTGIEEIPGALQSECSGKNFDCTQNYDDGVNNSFSANRNTKFGRNLEDELVCWSLLKQGGDIGMTHTKEGHRRLGLAKIATLNLATLLYRDGKVAFVDIVEDNDVAVKMHEDIGFEYHSMDLVIRYVCEDSTIF